MSASETLEQREEGLVSAGARDIRIGVMPIYEFLDLNTLEAGQDVRHVFVVASKEQAVARSKAPYLKVVLQNRFGFIQTRVWADQIHAWQGIRAGEPVLVTGVVERYNDAFQIKLSGVEPVRSEEAIKGVLPVCPVPLEELDRRYAALRARFTNPAFLLFLDRFFQVGCPWERFRTAPAAKSNHHAYIHGLYEHSIETAEFVAGIASHPRYADVLDINVAMAGALLHDSGKPIEYDWTTLAFGTSPAGRFGNHIGYGAVQLDRTWNAAAEELTAAGMTRDHLLHLMHVQWTHHGEPEKGALFEPRSPEAHLIHFADEISAGLRSMIDAARAGMHDGDGWFAAKGFFGGIFAPALVPEKVLRGAGVGALDEAMQIARAIGQETVGAATEPEGEPPA